jgi:hypothetical protein
VIVDYRPPYEAYYFHGDFFCLDDDRLEMDASEPMCYPEPDHYLCCANPHTGTIDYSTCELMF